MQNRRSVRKKTSCPCSQRSHLNVLTGLVPPPPPCWVDAQNKGVCRCVQIFLQKYHAVLLCHCKGRNISLVTRSALLHLWSSSRLSSGSDCTSSTSLSATRSPYSLPSGQSHVRVNTWTMSEAAIHRRSFHARKQTQRYNDNNENNEIVV